MRYTSHPDTAVMRASIPVMIDTIHDHAEEGFTGGWRFQVRLFGRPLHVDGENTRRFRTQQGAINAAKRAVREWASTCR